MRGIKIPVKAFKIKTKEEFVKTYSSIALAADELNLSESNIRRVLKGDRNRVGNYTFRKI